LSTSRSSRRKTDSNHTSNAPGGCRGPPARQRPLTTALAWREAIAPTARARVASHRSPDRRQTESSDAKRPGVAGLLHAAGAQATATPDRRRIDSISARLDITAITAPEPPAMPALTVRNLSEATHRALRVRAAEHGRSTEAEVRAILDEAVKPKIGLGTRLWQIGREFGGDDLDFSRDQTPARAVDFE
jgi:plasmid stability protein